jgi:hypothetical protein
LWACNHVAAHLLVKEIKQAKFVRKCLQHVAHETCPKKGTGLTLYVMPYFNNPETKQKNLKIV